MSSVGQAVGGVIGAVVGFFTPLGPLYGAQLGMMAGGYLDPPKGPTVEGPRLDDLTVQTSTYGAVIPRLYGTIATAGNVFWLENNKLKEKVKKTKSGGKGGGSNTTTKTYSYYATFAVGLCQGPIIGVRRIWVGSKLVYNAGSSDVDTIRASNAASSRFTVHLGTDTQLPDDRMQAALGVENTPAYRGLAYIVFKDLALADYGNSLLGAQVKAEVVKSGEVSTYVESVYTTTNSSSNMVRGIAWNGNVHCAVGDLSIQISKDGKTWQAITPPSAGLSWRDITWNGKIFCTIANTGGVSAVSKDGKIWKLGTLPSASGWNRIIWTGHCFIAIRSTQSNSVAASFDGVNWVSESLPESRYGSDIASNSNDIAVMTTSVNVLFVREGVGLGLNWKKITLPYSGSSGWSVIEWNGSVFSTLLYGSTIGMVSSDGIAWSEVALPAKAYPTRMIFNGDMFIVGSTGINVLFYSFDGIVWKTIITSSVSIYALGWDGAHIVTVSGQYRNKAYLYQPNWISTNYVLLSTIVATELQNSGLLGEVDFDVTSLNKPVRGYKIASISALRSSIEPLQGAFPFDVIQRGYKIVFKVRGSSSVATIPESDLDARSAGSSPGVSLTSVREMDSVLPRRVALSYLDANREYDPGEQYAERLNTDAINVRSVEMALVLTADEAAKIAEVLLYLYWMERYSGSFVLPSKYNHIEPGDVVSIQTSQGSYGLRLTDITYTQDGRLECQVKYNAAATYSPTAIGVSGTESEQTITQTGVSVMELLDIPLMLDSADQSGFVAALCGTNSAWSGGVVVRSDDNGQTWAEIQGFEAPGSVIGLASTVIGAGRTDIFDTASVLGVGLYQGALSSTSELAVLNGANWFAYGVHGRWEIIAAKTCALQADGSYLLTDLLRGRKGTEWARGLHEVGDSVVLLESSSVDFVNSSLDSIGKSRIYRGVTSGLEIESASDTEFTYAGVNLECLSPVFLNGNRHPTTNDWALEWVRRTRVGGEWRDYVDATLGEASESYEVEIFSSSAYTTIKRTLTGLSSPSATYTSAQQVTDFGSNQSTLYVKVYQLSASVGRGYPLTTSITR